MHVPLQSQPSQLLSSALARQRACFDYRSFHVQAARCTRCHLHTTLPQQTFSKSKNSLNQCTLVPVHTNRIPSTTSLQMTPQSHTCGSEFARVSRHSSIHMRIPARNATISTTHIVRANAWLQTFKYHKHTKQTHHHHTLLANSTTANTPQAIQSIIHTIY